MLVQIWDRRIPLGLDLNLGCKHHTANNNLLRWHPINNAGIFEKQHGRINWGTYKGNPLDEFGEYIKEVVLFGIRKWLHINDLYQVVALFPVVVIIIIV